MTSFYLPVCSENLVKLLTYGLISADTDKPLSEKNRFVPDALSDYDGYIPLFIDKVPSSEIDKIIKTDKYLHSCILKIDTKTIISGAYLTDNAVTCSFPYKTQEDYKNKYIKVKGPLPVTLIKELYFEHKEAKEM